MAIGTYALRATCGNTACRNVAVGHAALCSNTTGYTNTAVGWKALAANTTGYTNTALGDAALCSNTTGNWNTAIGRESMKFSTTGDCNVIIGPESMTSANVGDNNVGVGAKAFAGNTDGASSTSIGHHAGTYLANGSTELTSPANSTYLGALTRGKVIGDSNVTVIGYCACACGDNTVSIGNGSVTNTYLKGCLYAPASVGVGGESPSASNCMVIGGNAACAIGSILACSNVAVCGTLSKASGSFDIAHPLPALSATKRLIHSFVEAPQADNIYSGIIQLSNGSATVNIDDCSGMTDGTFTALNRCFRAFTTNETNWDPVRGSVSGNTLTVESCVADSDATVSWMVLGERQDTHMKERLGTDNTGKLIVELDTPEEDV